MLTQFVYEFNLELYQTVPSASHHFNFVYLCYLVIEIPQESDIVYSQHQCQLWKYAYCDGSHSQSVCYFIIKAQPLHPQNYYPRLYCFLNFEFRIHYLEHLPSYSTSCLVEMDSSCCCLLKLQYPKFKQMLHLLQNFNFLYYPKPHPIFIYLLIANLIRIIQVIQMMLEVLQKRMLYQRDLIFAK